jgi:hypothetical protein
MSTTVSLPRRSTTSRRNQILASATALAAAAAVAVTLAVAGSDGQTASTQPVPQPASAQPDLATQYRNESAVPSGPERQAGESSADRFHHFR